MTLSLKKSFLGSSLKTLNAQDHSVKHFHTVLKLREKSIELKPNGRFLWFCQKFSNCIRMSPNVSNYSTLSLFKLVTTVVWLQILYMVPAAGIGSSTAEQLMLEQPIRTSFPGPVPLLFSRLSGKDTAQGQFGFCGCFLLGTVSPAFVLQQPVITQIIHDMKVQKSRMPIAHASTHGLFSSSDMQFSWTNHHWSWLSHVSTRHLLVQIMKIFRFRYYAQSKFLGQSIRLFFPSLCE